jgi:hypothetical protein
MKRTNLFFLLSLFVSVIAFSSCDDEETIEKSAYIGNYTIDEATLSETVIIPVVVEGMGEINYPLPVGEDITVMIQNALLNAIPDCDASSSLVEFREDFTMYMSCATSDFSVNAGTWEEKDNGTVLILNFNSTAIPSSPTGFSLTVTNVKLEGNIMSSTATVPIPKELIAEMVKASGQALLSDSAPAMFMFTFDMKFLKK